jgi:hypothetical protein
MYNPLSKFLRSICLPLVIVEEISSFPAELKTCTSNELFESRFLENTLNKSEESTGFGEITKAFDSN